MIKLLASLIPHLLMSLPKDIIKTGIDKLLDVIEDAVEKSETEIDDATILPICKMIRDSLGIPDNDE